MTIYNPQQHNDSLHTTTQPQQANTSISSSSINSLSPQRSSHFLSVISQDIHGEEHVISQVESNTFTTLSAKTIKALQKP
nr:unnamed protein product [Naegleria fowleri]